MRADTVSLYGEEYVNGFEKNQSIERLRRLLPLMNLPPQSSVADFACGNGMLMELIAPLVREYTGVDFSQHFIDAANRKKAHLAIPNARFVCANIEDFCAEHLEYSDIALAMDASEHIQDSEWISILASIKSSLKSRGRFYLHTPNADFFVEIMKSKNFLFKQFKEHIAVRNPRQNAELLYRAGFSKIETVFLPHYNLLKYLQHLLLYRKWAGILRQGSLLRLKSDGRMRAELLHRKILRWASLFGWAPTFKIFFETE